MNHIKQGWMRAAFVAAIAVGVMAGFCDDAAAKHGGKVRYAHRQARHLHNSRSPNRETAQAAWPQPVELGPMRYYGGPKSPMWRAPAAN
jgi:hypothetical protein